jgi:hypothetical protein
MKQTLAIVSLLVLILARCGGSGDCTEASYLAVVEPVLGRWTAIIEVMDLTPQSGRESQAERMRAIRQEAEDLPVPDCTSAAHRELIGYMDAVIEAVDASLAGESFEEVGRLFGVADGRREEWVRLSRALGE